MEEWQHCAKEWVWIPVETAVENIVAGSIVKCQYRGREYYFNIPNQADSKLSLKMIKTGKWSVYTWSS